MKQRQDTIVQEAIALFQRLQQRRQELQGEIDAIDRALGQFRGVAPTAAVKSATIPRRKGRGQNSMPLREAVTQVLSGGAKTRQELLRGVQQLGYRFSATDPMNSLQAFLYGTGKKLFTREDGKFALVGGASGATSAKNGANKPAKVKRTMSPAARKKIAAAQRARWAKVKAAKK